MSVLEAMAARRPFRLGEVEAEPDGAGGWVVRGPEGDEPREVEPEEGAVRAAVRFDERGRYRPLSGARGMPRGWFVRCRNREELERVIETIYPLALVHIRQLAEGSLRVVGLDAVLRRQSGRYEVAAELSEEGRELATAVVCGACVRVPVWTGKQLTEPSGIPCPEPCSVLVSFCREAAIWEREGAVPGEDDPSVPFADFEAEGNPLRNAYLRARAAAPSGKRR